MAGSNEKREFGRRIEDFIALAKEGKKVHAEIALKRLPIKHKIRPGTTEDMRMEVDMYLFMGDYTFRIGKEVNHVCKVYMYGYLKEPAGVFSVNTNIANARLKADYRRLREANIVFEEKYF
jgi:hypothetical protein